MLTNIGLCASMALVANAILLPPNLATDSFGDDRALETLSINPLQRTVALECPGCAVASVEGDHLAWTQNTGNSYLLNFEIGREEDTLEIDGVQLYPPVFGRLLAPFSVAQVNPHKGPEETDDALRLQVTGYTFHYNSAETVTEDGAELLPLEFRLTSIEFQAVDPPALTINLLKDANGRLMIASFEATAKPKPNSPADQEKECQEWPLYCKWKHILADKVEGVKNSIGKGCHKMKGGNPMEQDTPYGKPPHKSQPSQHHAHHHEEHHHHHKGHHHHHDGHHHHHDGHHHKMHMAIRRAFFTVLIPILIGIFAGTLTYLIGMALGCLIAVIVAKVRGSSAYEPVSLDDEEEGPAAPHDSEKAVYAELPEYDAPPVYEEAAEKEVVNEA